ncbi:LOW QUALITY PROTEIN: RWD domain-containing protein 3-like [Oculina patagonica]
MTATEVFDEILALKSIFCNPGEFYLISPSSLEELESSTGPISFKIAVKCTAEQESNDATKSLEKTEKNTLCFVVEMTVVIPLNYPQTLPEISLSCTEISKKGVTSLRDKLIEYAGNQFEKNHSSSSEPMIMEIIAMWLQENASLFFDKRALNIERNDSSGDDSILLLKLDHMRNKNRYIRTITRWIDELNLNGRLFFASYLILILLTGETDNVREYLRRHKTCNVDVDSSGKPCKERMINVLVQEKAPSNLRICGLGEGECKSLSELEERFTELNLEHFFKEHIKPLL